MFTDPHVQALLTRFVPAADEVTHGLTVPGVEGDLFRKITAIGHPVHGSTSRQGIYAATADGDLLDSIHPILAGWEPAAIAGMLERALAKWDAIPPEGRPRGEASGTPPPYFPPNVLLPSDGVALQMFARDLPRPSGGCGDWRDRAWNIDHVWLTAEDARTFLPWWTAPGRSTGADPRIARRMARFHFLDVVRGQTLTMERQHVSRAWLKTKVLSLEAGSVRLELRGEFAGHQIGSWSVDGDRTRGPQERGLRGRLLGRAVMERGSGRFRSFEAVLLGTRWGGTAHNGRSDDLQPNPIGFALVLSDDPMARIVTPAWVQSFWREIDYWTA